MADVNVLALFPHYFTHMAPIIEALRDRGVDVDVWSTWREASWATYISNAELGRAPADGLWMCAGSTDAERLVGVRRFVYVEHGSGQTYDADVAGVNVPAYSTGPMPGAAMFLCPNRFVQVRRQRRYPDVPAVLVGSPALDEWHGKAVGFHAGVQVNVAALAWHWNLIPEGQVYSGPRPIGGSVERYEGEIIEAVVAGTSHRLAVSPKHPVLTTRGWVLACELRQGDYLVRRERPERLVRLGPNDDLPEARVEQVAGALLETLRVRPGAVPTASPHLHGETPDAEVDVVRADGTLLHDVEFAAVAKHVDHGVLQGAALSGVRFTGDSAGRQLLDRGMGPAARSVHGQGLQLDAIAQSPIRRGWGDADLARELVNGSAGAVSLHEVIDLSVRQYSGHGYDFTTMSRWYEVNGFVVHNCGLVPESRTAFNHYKAGLKHLAISLRRKGVVLVGTAHPRIRSSVRPVMSASGIEWWESADVLTHAALLCFDNTSFGYEFASLDRPTIALNAPWYRRDVNHGLRFWELIPGPQCDDIDQLEALILAELADPDPERRRSVTDFVYPVRDGLAAQRAAEAVLTLL